MTREEAIERLKSIKSLVDKYDDVVALREATKALEQEKYYKSLAQSYERTIVKLTEAIAEQQPSEDCVSRQAMLDAITEIDGNINMDIYTNEVREIIENLPPVTPTRKKGKWIFKDNSRDMWCSNCDASFEETPQDFNFCPNCGAEMESEE